MNLNENKILYLFLLRILSACGLLIYCSTICFHLRRQSQPRKKLCTFFIFSISVEPSATPLNPAAIPLPCTFDPCTVEFTVCTPPTPTRYPIHGDMLRCIPLCSA